MKNWVSLLIFAVIVATITLTLAPPARTSAEPSIQHSAVAGAIVDRQ